MAIKEYSTTYSGANPTQDADPITGVQPDLDDETAVGAGDGDEARSSHPETLRDKLQAAAKLIGDSVNAPAGSVVDILDRDHANGDARQVRLRERASDPTSATNIGFIYTKDVSGTSELFFEDSAGNVIQLTSGGSTPLASHASTHQDGGSDEISVTGLSGLLADDQNALALRETSGPTLLTVGSIADGEYAVRSGSTLIGGTPAGDPSPLTTKGDLYTYDTDDQRLAVGSDGQVLKANSATATGLEWAAESGGASPLTTKGDIYTYDTDDQRLAVGTDGQVLTADSAEATGIKWADAAATAVTAPAQAITLFEADVLSTQTISSGTFADIPGSALPEDTFVVGVAGTYDLTVLLSSLSSATIGQQAKAEYQLIIDEGDYNGFTEQTIGANAASPKGWDVFTVNADTTGVEYKTVFASVTLEAGTHKAKFEAKTNANSPRVSSDTSFSVKGILRSGSGAGGTIDDKKELSSAVSITGTLSPDTPTEVTGLESTVTVAENERLEIIFSGQSYAPNAGVSSIYVHLDVDGTRVGSGTSIVSEYHAAQFEGRNLSFSYVTDPLTAGSHTIKYYAAKFDSGQANWDFYGSSTVRIYRGGLVPIRNNGTTIQDTPVATDYGAGFVVTNNAGVAQVEASSNWRYLNATDLPTGAAAPEAVWQFDGTGSQLNDRTANGHDLTVGGGTLLQTAAEGIAGISSNNSYYLTAASPAGIRTLGAFTAEFLVSMESGASIAMDVGGNSEAAENNILIRCVPNSGVNKLQQFHEYGSGVDVDVPYDARMTFGRLTLLTFTRSSDGLTCNAYLDGVLVDTVVVANAPTEGAGSTASVYLMGDEGATAVFNGSMFCARFTKEEWSAAQVLESYKYCRKIG